MSGERADEFHITRNLDARCQVLTQKPSRQTDDIKSIHFHNFDRLIDHGQNILTHGYLLNQIQFFTLVH